MEVTVVVVTKDGHFPMDKGGNQAEFIKEYENALKADAALGINPKDKIRVKYGPTYNNPSVLLDILQKTDWIVEALDVEADIAVIFKSDEHREDAIRILSSNKYTNSFDALVNFSDALDSDEDPIIHRDGVHTVVLLPYEYPADARDAFRIIGTETMKAILSQVRKNPDDEKETVAINCDKRLDNPKTLARLLENGDNLILTLRDGYGYEDIFKFSSKDGDMSLIKAILNSFPDGTSAHEGLQKYLPQ